MKLPVIDFSTLVFNSINDLEARFGFSARKGTNQVNGCREDVQEAFRDYIQLWDLVSQYKLTYPRQNVSAALRR